LPPAALATNALGPRLTFATNEYNFGMVEAGTVVKYVFVARNTGDQALVISEVEPGCHCTSVGDWTGAERIEPGKSGQIPVEFNSSTFAGGVIKDVMVLSNDKAAPMQTLSLTGTVREPIEVKPP
jgi:hypothetical protein